MLAGVWAASMFRLLHGWPLRDWWKNAGHLRASNLRSFVCVASFVQPRAQSRKASMLKLLLLLFLHVLCSAESSQGPKSPEQQNIPEWPSERTSTYSFPSVLVVNLCS